MNIALNQVKISDLELVVMVYLESESKKKPKLVGSPKKGKSGAIKKEIDELDLDRSNTPQNAGR